MHARLQQAQLAQHMRAYETHKQIVISQYSIPRPPNQGCVLVGEKIWILVL